MYRHYANEKKISSPLLSLHPIFPKISRPPISLTPNAIEPFTVQIPGNVREFKNITNRYYPRKNRVIDEETLSKYLKKNTLSNLPMIIPSTSTDKNELFERELIYKFLIDMKREMTELKALVNQIIQDEDVNGKIGKTVAIPSTSIESESILHFDEKKSEDSELFEDSVVINEQFSLLDSEKELIKKALKKHNNRRKEAAKELGISERTLYRKIKELDL